jgi:NAD+ kinase
MSERGDAVGVRAVGLVPHRERARAHELARSTVDWLAAHGVEVRVPNADALAAGLDAYAVDPEKFADGLDLVISFGGDGTMLYTVQLVYPAPVPIIGVNVGQLAYLSEIEPEELATVLPRLVSRQFQVSERMVLEVDVESTAPAVKGTRYALNEAVLEKQRTGHMIRLEVSINGSPFTSYAADGLIVATPTGTTAYSFSARGPIASPALRCTVLTPISPHMLFDRSLVLGEHEELEFLVCDGRCELTIDGRELGPLAAGDRVRCRAAADPLRLATVHPRDFHQILKMKFALPDR